LSYASFRRSAETRIRLKHEPPIVLPGLVLVFTQAEHDILEETSEKKSNHPHDQAKRQPPLTSTVGASRQSLEHIRASSIDSIHSSHASQVTHPCTVHQSIVSAAWLGTVSMRLQVYMSPRSNVPTYPPMNPQNGSARHPICADRDGTCHSLSTKRLSARPHIYIIVIQKSIDSTTTLLGS
jgi:hypothetical protein